MAKAAEPGIDFLDLDEAGSLLDGNGKAVAPADLRHFLPARLRVPSAATDIVVFAHGWRNDRPRAAASVRRLLDGLESQYAEHRTRYPGIPDFRPYAVGVRWPSMSNPFPWGYRRIRDRAHAMTTEGQAGHVLAHLLGYLNRERRVPIAGGPRLGTVDSQYLHCVGHSFGGRFLGEAIMAAASPSGPPRLAWPWTNPDYPYAVDTLLVFQMAARPTIFDEEFAGLLRDAPISGPVALTFSRYDRATRLWHRLAEGVKGIGAVGSTSPAGQTSVGNLHRLDEPYDFAQMSARVWNVDAHWRFRQGRWWRPEGAHSDIWHPESMHLLLALAASAR
ncbi:alpha/beta hydrolase family protein [Hamadaea tsunoensis]|uniref:alpha/beta hydrolase n=1 Tax=Hamadaea tsunoensis TaxID=53368 RepID=UPI000484E7FC|nr:alpha/beta hydrolase [Hamadaea tsunoensis]